MYVGFLWAIFRELGRIRKRAPDTPNGQRIVLESIAITLGLTGTLVAGIFSDRLYGEVVYWLAAFTALLRHMLNLELKAEEGAANRSEGADVSEPAALA